MFSSSNLFNFSRPIYLRSIVLSDIEIYLTSSPCFPRPIDLNVSRPIYLAMTSSPRVRRALIGPTLIPRGCHAVAMVSAALAFDTVCGSSRSIPRDSIYIDYILYSIPRSRDLPGLEKIQVQ